jgi:dihydrofolate reductase
MKISLIAAMDKKNGIGFQGKIPWHLHADMVHFKEITMGHHILMGDVTWDGMGRDLPGRKVVVLTLNKSVYAPQHAPAFVADNIPEAIECARSNGETEFIVAGGQAVYRQMIGLVDVMYLTIVEQTFNCDRFFPQFERTSWNTTNEELRCEDHLYFTVMTLVRKEPRTK